jgi:hypothetical protein
MTNWADVGGIGRPKPPSADEHCGHETSLPNIVAAPAGFASGWTTNAAMSSASRAARAGARRRPIPTRCIAGLPLRCADRRWPTHLWSVLRLLCEGKHRRAAVTAPRPGDRSR